MSERIQTLLLELKQGLTHIYGNRLKAVYLYGSYARGEANPASDVDVMIVLDEYQSYGKEIDRTGELVSHLSLEYGLSISRIITKEVQWQKSATPLLRNIRAEGIAA
ncbi:MAG: nucleotidyltransferase domain-containing protein [Anaerolineales bacterium]